jgi:hypothetical protein
MADHMAALDGGTVGAGEIQSDPLAPAGRVDGMAVDLQTAHTKEQIAGQAAHLIADLDLAGERRSSHYDSMPLEHESAIDWQAKIAAGRRLVPALEDFRDTFLERLDALAGGR